jgi:hypothetical protein
MPKRYVRTERALNARKCPAISLLLSGFLLTILAPESQAQVTLGPVTVGAGLQTSFVGTVPVGGSTTDQFQLNHARIYISGPVFTDIKFMFNTEYDSVTNKLEVMDAAAQFEFSPEFNIWAGRFLPPSDRANLYGPFFSNNWAVYTDGVQDGYPSAFEGRDNGVTYWGTFAKKVKVSLGAFDGGSADGNSKILGATRVQVDFWDPEDGYFQNATYYGDKNLLAIGGAGQLQDGKTGSSLDFLMERKLPGGKHGVITIESEYTNYNRLGGYQGAYAKSQGAYGLGSYLFPKSIGPGNFEILGKYAKAEYTHGATPSFDQKTTEINFDYVIKQFKARVMSFFTDTKFNRVLSNFWQAGVGIQVQM